MRKLIIGLVLTMFLFVGTTFSQTVNTEVYGNYGYGIDSVLSTKGDFAKGESKFNVKDVFLGVDYSLTDNFTSGAKLRYNSDSDKVNLYTADISYFNNVSKDLDLTLSLGKTETFWYSYTNKLWNNYAIDNVISDKFKLTERTEVGLKATLVNKNIVGSFEVGNGVNNKNKAFKLSTVVIPFDNFKIGAFFNNDKFNNDTMDFSYNTYGGNVFYKLTTKKSGTINFYGEYIQLAPNIEYGKKIEGFTLHSEYFFNESPFSLLVRFDNYNDLNSKSHEQYLTGGVNYSPNTKYKFGLNWRNFKNLTVAQSHNEVYFTAGFNF